jgi:hypothetical protein
MKMFYPAVMGLSIVAIAPFSPPGIAQTAPPSNPVTPTSSCLLGYPDGTYRGNQPITRYEFAAAMNACLDQVLEPLHRGNLATREEFETTLQQQRELNQELYDLNQRVEPSATPNLGKRSL